MPHCYSEESWRRRRERAIARGFARSAPWGHRYILVEAGFHRAVVASYQSLRARAKHGMLTGVTHHYGRLAGIHAFQGGYIDESELRATVGVHRRAGRMKHGISSRQTADVTSELRERDAEEPDALFYSDPWDGKSVDIERAAVSCETDVWQAWHHRHVEQTEADESCVGGRLIVDVLANEACRVLHLALGDSIGSLPTVEMTTTTSTTEAELDDTAAEEECENSDTCSGGAQDAEFDVQVHDRRIESHSASLRRFWEEWEQVEDCMRFEAEQLSIGSVDGDE